jgi:DNA invertase Pin-like site-specific DNA recombinase
LPKQPQAKLLRCAIYTRVSTEHGLEQEFNSLDNQREAAEAYIKSQAHEGWRMLPSRYDDGGYSGGSMDRPSLKQLLADIQARLIDVVVVYKVDRLTRSLADFAKLVELFDRHGVSFVSVTQSFNTTSSMGRLTLNVLLSFAQFEREVTGERIRDKIAASKKKGLWMGGQVPLGYRVQDRALHIMEEHALLIRSLFERYLTFGSVVRLKAALDQEGITVPERQDRAGRVSGGGAFSRGHLHKILTNPIYIGQITHREQVHQGQHPPILDRTLWHAVQERLASQTCDRGTRQPSEALLVGRLYDDCGHRMTPTWAAKGDKRFRYYVSQALLQGRKAEAGSCPRVPAEAIETAVAHAIADHRTSIGARGAGIGREEADGCLPEAVERIVIGSGQLVITIKGEGEAGETRTIQVLWTSASPRRQRAIIPCEAMGENAALRPMRVEAHAKLIKGLRLAHSWLDELLADPTCSTRSIAEREGRSERSVRMLLSLAFVDPAIVTAALERRLPRGFGMSRLTDLPPDWSEQRQTLGLPATGPI